MARILVVDDSTFIRTMMRKYLEHNGHTVVAEAGTVCDAVVQYKLHKPDIVTLDIVMPDNCGFNGLEALRKILKFDSRANIIICSGMAQQSMVIEAMKSGAKYFLVKPAEEVLLIKTINHIMLKSAANA